MYNVGGLPFLTSGVYQAMFMEAYEKALQSPKEKQMMDIVNSLFAKAEDNNITLENSYLSAAPDMVEFNGTTPLTGGTEQGMVIKKVVYKAAQVIRRDLLESSQGERLFRSRVNSLAARAATFKRRLLTDLIMTNGVCADGANFFAATHSFEMSGVQSNTSATAFAAGVGYEALLPSFLTLKDSRGAEIGMEPTVVAVSPTLWPAAVRYFNPSRVLFSDAGVASGGMLVSPDMYLLRLQGTQKSTVSATCWYMFTGGEGLEPFVVYQTADPKIDITPVGGDEYIRHDRLTIQAYWHAVASYGPWFHGFRGNS